jgi:hypothetical protein
VDSAGPGLPAANGPLGPEWAESDSFAPPQIFMAWHAPHGMPGATDTLTFAPGDSTRVDTLYLSFETGRDIRKFIGMWARLVFHPAEGDTLGEYWRFASGEANQGNLQLQFDPDGTFPCAQPWIRAGAAFPKYEFDPHAGVLELFYVNLNLPSIVAVDGRVRYCYARVMFVQKRADLAGARQPVCIEWTRAVFSAGRDDAVAERGPARCVSVNSPGGGVCAPFRRDRGPSPWLPPNRRVDVSRPGGR